MSAIYRNRLKMEYTVCTLLILFPAQHVPTWWKVTVWLKITGWGENI